MLTADSYRAAAILDQVEGKLGLQAKQHTEWLARVKAGKANTKMCMSEHSKHLFEKPKKKHVRLIVLLCQHASIRCGRDTEGYTVDALVGAARFARQICHFKVHVVCAWPQEDAVNAISKQQT
jgi:hypothetical protein